MPRQAEMHELVGAYALNALEPDEAEQFERHLASCPRCRAELRDHRETAALLAHAGAAAPAGVWDRIAAQLEAAPEGVEDIVPIFRRPAAKQTWWRRNSSLVATAAAALMVLTGVAVIATRDTSVAPTMQALADRAASQSGSHFATLRKPDGTAVADIVITKDGTGYLTRGSLPLLDEEHTYQLWGLPGEGDGMVSLGVLGRQPVARSFSVQLPIAKVAISVEKAGGSDQPTSPPFVAGDVTT